MTDKRDYNLLSHNTFGIDALCRRFLEYETIGEAMEVAAILRNGQTPYMIIGGGSNLLLVGNYDGTVVRSAIKGIKIEGDNQVTAGSGEEWDRVVKATADSGFPNLVNLSLIPGDVGASVVQNIGAYGEEVGRYVKGIEAVEIATGRLVDIDPRDCCYSYRDSRFKHEWKGQYLIVRVTYSLDRHAPLNTEYGNIRAELERRNIYNPTPQQLRDVIIGIRQEKLPDPKVTGNAGSFFMNPIVNRQKYEALAADYPQMPHYDVDHQHVKIPAGWLIEQCGWKGRSLGRAGVHDKQALVLVNLGGATGREIVALCKRIQHDVSDKFGINIKPEVNICV